MGIEEELNQYVHGRRDSARELALARQLRQLPEEERFRIIWEILPRPYIGLLFAKRCLQNPKYFRAILMRGLENPNPQGIKSWLECTVPPLGVRRVLSILTRKLETDPMAVCMAVYWMPRYIPEEDARSWEALQEIKADERYQHSTGRNVP